MSQSRNIVIIGGIAAGMSVAAKARREDPTATITVIEKENYISFGACGLPYYLGGEFEDSRFMFARTPAQIEKSGIHLRLQTSATAIDFDAQRISLQSHDGEVSALHYDRLMIATGASPNQLPFEGMKAENVYLHTKLQDADALKAALETYQSITIIGGGFIGVEVADQLAHLGKKVTIIQSGEHIMQGPFDTEFSELMETALQDASIDIRLSQKVVDLALDSGKVSAVITDNDQIATDAVVVAIGFKPNTDFITDPRLEKLANGAIVINEYGETSIPNVFSGGDCATVPHRFLGNRYIPLATSANKLGRVIGTNIVSEKSEYLTYPGSLGSSLIKVGDCEAGSTGLTEKMAKTLENHYKTTLITTPNHTNYYRGQTTLTIKLVYEADSKVLVGAQIFGKKDAALRLHAFTVAIHAGMTTDELGLIDLGYAPPFTTTWEAINIAANTAK